MQCLLRDVQKAVQDVVQRLRHLSDLVFLVKISWHLSNKINLLNVLKG